MIFCVVAAERLLSSTLAEEAPASSVKQVEAELSAPSVAKEEPPLLPPQVSALGSFP